MERVKEMIRAKPLPAVVTGLLALFVILFPLTVDLNALRGFGTRSFFIQPRVAVLYFTVWIALLALLALANRRWQANALAHLRSAPALIALAVALVAFATAPLFATLTDLEIGYHGPINRGDGAWMFVISLILAALAARLAFLFRPAGWVVVISLVLVASLVGAMSAYQGTGGDLWELVGLVGLNVGAGSATMGSPVFITVVSGMALVFGLTLWISWFPENRAQWIAWSVGIPVSGWLGFSIIASGGRSAIIGTAVVFGVWLALSLWSVRSRAHPPGLWRYAPTLALGLAVVLGAYLGNEAGGRGAAKMRELGMVFSDDRMSEMNTATRVWFYGSAIDGVLKQPIRPYGVNSFMTVIWEAATPERFEILMDHYEYVPAAYLPFTVREGNTFIITDPTTGQEFRRETFHDKAHNYILDVWLAFGLIPLLALVAFLALSWFRMLQARTPLSLGAAGAVIVYAIYAQAWFPAPATDPLLFILLGIGWGDAERALRPSLVDAEQPKLSRADFRRLQRKRK